MSVRVLIADDEAPARRKLTRLLAAHTDVEVVGEASNGIDAVDLIGMTDPELVFLDIHMPELDGLGVAQAISAQSTPPAIVFVTAHDQFAVKAFEVNAVDYLLKPFDEERFEKALSRAREAMGKPRTGDELAALLAKTLGEQQYVRRLLVAKNGRSHFVPIDQIVQLEADGNNVVVHARGASATLRSTLESLEARLDPARFARVHRSHIVNIDEIAEIEPWFRGDYQLKLRDGTQLPWSRRYAAKRPDLLK